MSFETGVNGERAELHLFSGWGGKGENAPSDIFLGLARKVIAFDHRVVLFIMISKTFIHFSVLIRIFFKKTILNILQLKKNIIEHLIF